MRREELTELADDLEELRDALCDVAEGDVMPADIAMRGHVAMELLIASLKELADG